MRLHPLTIGSVKRRIGIKNVTLYVFYLQHEMYLLKSVLHVQSCVM